MSPVQRWLIVAAVVAITIGVPVGLRALPTNDSPISSGRLLQQIRSSTTLGYSGYVETLGTIQLPVSDDFTDIGDLLGERTRMRVWWRSSEDWRVDKLLTTGETDLFRDPRGITQWEYEKARVTRMTEPQIRLPRDSDLLPPQLAARVLQGVASSEVSRLPATSVAGLAAPGLRVTPSASQSTIDHVDIWADPSTGIPLRVLVYGNGTDEASFTTEFMHFSRAVPSRESTAFSPPVDAEIRTDDVIDIADAANQFGPFRPPQAVAGLSRAHGPDVGGVGVYGSGATQLIAIPLWDRAAEPLRKQMEATPGVHQIDEGDILLIGPLSMLLTHFSFDDGGWLVAGTVTEQTLVAAAHDLRFRWMAQR